MHFKGRINNETEVRVEIIELFFDDYQCANRTAEHFNGNVERKLISELILEKQV